MSGQPVLTMAPRGGCAEVVLTRTALDMATVTALAAALDEAEATASTRVLVISSQAPAFCTGMPLSHGTLPPDAAAAQEQLSALLVRLARSRLITIALVDGAAMAGGLALCAACDLVVAGPRATFRITELQVGLVPSVLLPIVARRTGYHRAFTLALTARSLSVEEALAMGLVDHTDDDPRQARRQILRALRGTDAAAAAAVKAYYNQLAPPDSFGIHNAVRAFQDRLLDPGVHSRLARFSQQGILA
ncbi:enoyl-CoA hydratase-related protein [Streptomyces sp. ISID311]|uniref:enoyl-CoA hydratase-related protein n=1 Tax=Streptomyces sp. ISID311 TaxID=2601673 RepID=UPI0011BD3EC8|nr:enoyl-CoA hydratase-related protein [Streptomyces sp. ISID311]TXC99870.1 hypothetical protein FS847_00975 [Streptomyces sp. ISID311]